MNPAFLADLHTRTEDLRDQGLFKSERVIASPQSAHIRLSDGTTVLNLCANNYLGLASHPEIVAAVRLNSKFKNPKSNLVLAFPVEPCSAHPSRFCRKADFQNRTWFWLFLPL